MAGKVTYRRKVTACDGESFEVDVSDKTCQKYGFRANDEVITCFEETAIVMGVAPAPKGSRVAGQDVLWYLKADGKTYYFGPGDLSKAGFKLKVAA